MPVAGMIAYRSGFIGRSLFVIGEYLRAIAGRSGDAVGEPALEIQQYPPGLKQEESR